MKRGRGRPKEENTRDYILNFRFDNKDMYRLNKIIEATGDSKSGIIRIALRGYFMYLKEMEKNCRLMKLSEKEDGLKRRSCVTINIFDLTERKIMNI